MKVDTGMMAARARRHRAGRARELEDLGYDGLITAETGHDPFLPLVIAAEHTERIELGTGIAVAFARTPMLTANTAYDLQRHSEGRFSLGLGSQIKPHIEQSLLDAVVAPGGAHARVHPRDARDLGVVVGRHASSTSVATSTRTR